MAKALLERMKDLGVRDLVLANVPAESQTLTALTRIARSQGFHIHDRQRYNCGIIAFSDTAQRQDILQALLRKEKEKRSERNSTSPARSVFKDLEWGTIRHGLHAIFAAHVSRFLATNRLSSLIHAERRLFLIDLSRLLKVRGLAEVQPVVPTRWRLCVPATLMLFKLPRPH
jgi:hypothetical protein